MRPAFGQTMELNEKGLWVRKKKPAGPAEAQKPEVDFPHFSHRSSQVSESLWCLAASRRRQVRRRVPSSS